MKMLKRNKHVNEILMATLIELAVVKCPNNLRQTLIVFYRLRKSRFEYETQSQAARSTNLYFHPPRTGGAPCRRRFSALVLKFLFYAKHFIS